jgi:hypothetical protein
MGIFLNKAHSGAVWYGSDQQQTCMNLLEACRALVDRTLFSSRVLEKDLVLVDISTVLEDLV